MITTATRAMSLSPATASVRPSPSPSAMVRSAAGDASWHVAVAHAKLLEFLDRESRRDPAIAESLEAFLDDAVAATWRARTARPVA